MITLEQLNALRDDIHQTNTALAKLAIQVATLATDNATRLARLEDWTRNHTHPSK